MTDTQPILTEIARLSVQMESLIKKVDQIGDIDKRVVVLETKLTEAEKHVASVRWMAATALTAIIPLAVFALTQIFGGK